MNISFFLKPKSEVFYLFDDCSVEQAIMEMLQNSFTAIPLIDRHGHFIGTICEGDLLSIVMKRSPDKLNMPVGDVPRRFLHRSVCIDAHMEDMVCLIIDQNFVPVTDDRGMFIGIITRHDVIQYINYPSLKGNVLENKLIVD